MSASDIFEKEKMYSIWDILNWIENQISTAKDQEIKDHYMYVYFKLQSALADIMGKYQS